MTGSTAAPGIPGDSTTGNLSMFSLKQRHDVIRWNRTHLRVTEYVTVLTWDINHPMLLLASVDTYPRHTRLMQRMHFADKMAHTLFIKIFYHGHIY